MNNFMAKGIYLSHFDSIPLILPHALFSAFVTLNLSKNSELRSCLLSLRINIHQYSSMFSFEIRN